MSAQIKSFPVSGSTRGFSVDPLYMHFNWDESRRNETNDVLYPRSSLNRIHPGQIILGRYQPQLGGYGFWPTPHGFPALDYNPSKEEKEKIRLRGLDTLEFRVLGVAGTERSDFDKGKLYSVVCHSPMTKFINTGGSLIRDGQEVFARLPTNNECKAQMTKWGTYCFATEGRDRNDTARRTDDFLDYLRFGQVPTPEFHDAEEGRRALMSIFAAAGRLLCRDVVTRYELPGDYDKWEANDAGDDFQTLFTDESHRNALKRLLFTIVKCGECVKSSNDHLILGQAIDDVAPYMEGKIKLTV